MINIYRNWPQSWMRVQWIRRISWFRFAEVPLRQSSKEIVYVRKTYCNSALLEQRRAIEVFRIKQQNDLAAVFGLGVYLCCAIYYLADVGIGESRLIVICLSQYDAGFVTV